MSTADRYWNQFVEARPFAVRPDRPYVEAFSFGFDATDAAEIAELVREGKKTAPGSVLWAYAHDGKPVPAVGDHWVVLEAGDRPACIIRTTRVEILPFDEVPEIYAELGGEGDCSVAHWQAIYGRYIDAECARMGREPSASAPLVMERFEVVYAEPPEDAAAGVAASGPGERG